jgi:uncharacterized protein (TIGR02246 family)
LWHPRILGLRAGRPWSKVQLHARSHPEEVHALIAEAFSTGDLDAFAQLHEPHATAIVPPAGTRVSGRDAIREAVEPIVARAPQAQIEVVEKLEADGLALTHARRRVGEMSGRGAIVSRRQPGGTWRIVIDNPMSP